MMKGYAGSKTNQSDRDLWMTPKYVYIHYNRRFGFSHDVAASKENHLAPSYFTEEDNALTKEWGMVNWLNPPYSKTGDWVDKAIEQSSSDRRQIVVMLVPAATSVAWFEKAMKHCSECHIITGRIGFISNETGEPVNNNNIGSVVFVFDGMSPVRSHVSMIHRDDMKGINKCHP
jgi:phage N-6-adenine-methyltransferase